ncbi:hypothetical protein [Ruminococcus sp.]|uniref:hypothetical protein n=1 Tax=Ruminococcus sp. TaxID=41978 RepID=UPI00386648F1
MEEKTILELQQELTKLKKAQVRIKRKFTFLLSIIAMLVLITATLAWFTLSNFASVNEINLKISTAPELYLDIENRGTDVSLWKKVLTNDMINQYLSSVNAPKIDEQRLDPVTTSNGISFQSQSGSARNANETSSFLEFKVWFIATTDMYVHLSGQTVQVEGNNATTACTTTETGAKADIVNALRVSYEDNGSAAIWEPHKGSPVAGQSSFDVNQSFGSESRLFHLDTLTPKQITFRIWAEGEDPECDNDVQAANVTIQMLFGGADEAGNSFE